MIINIEVSALLLSHDNIELVGVLGARSEETNDASDLLLFSYNFECHTVTCVGSEETDDASDFLCLLANYCNFEYRTSSVSVQRKPMMLAT